MACPRTPSATPLTSKRVLLTDLERKEAVPFSASAGDGTASFRFEGVWGASYPPSPPGGIYFFRFSASSSEMCVTLRPLPSFSAPPRI